MPFSSDLRHAVDDLAMKIVVGDESSGRQAALVWAEAIEKIRDRALGEQAADVASEAGTLLDLIRGTSDPDGRRLQDGIARLQQVIEREGQPEPAPSQSFAEDAELLNDFLLEGSEHLANIESQVLTLERKPSDPEALNSVFRSFHTFKGLAGFLELHDVQSLAHEVETVLDRARQSQATITPEMIDIILQSADGLRRWLTHLEARLTHRPSEPPARDEALLGRIRAVGKPAAATAEAPAPPDAPAPPTGERPPGPRPAEESTPSDSPSSAEVSPIQAGRSAVPAIKVDTSKLDYLVDMAGEMVIAQSLVRHDPDLNALKNQRLQRNIAQLTRITAELQKTAMAMRLMPIGPLFRRMARLVRDLARRFDKRVEMETQGDDIELDRTIIEELADPLMHMVRNALDHGLESPAERVQRGKDPTGHVLLKAHHRSGQVVIEIADDGRGLDRDKIVAKAVQKGLVASGAGLSDSEAYRLIFTPGFTTAAQVTSISGRGVGMDVVHRSIEKLRGRVEIQSAPGRGATFLMRLPLTLAIIDGLVVGVGRERYIVPLFSVRELLRLDENTVWTVQERGEMALVRGALLPVMRLYRLFGVTPRSEDPRHSVLVIGEVAGQSYALMVDELVGKQEVVIKSLGETFRNVRGIAGSAILGDGRVGLILDLDRLFKEPARTSEPWIESS